MFTKMAAAEDLMADKEVPFSVILETQGVVVSAYVYSVGAGEVTRQFFLPWNSGLVHSTDMTAHNCL